MKPEAAPAASHQQWSGQRWRWRWSGRELCKL